MPRPKEQARVLMWKGKWHLFYTDHQTGKKVRKLCATLKASNPKQRAELVKQYRAKEQQQQAETIIRGGTISDDRLLVDDVNDYLKHSRERAKNRAANPEARQGLADSTLGLIEDKVGLFLTWLEARQLLELKTKDLDVSTLDEFFSFVTRETVPKAKTQSKKRTAATINLYRRNLKACLRWINDQRPRRFPDFAPLLRPLRSQAGGSKLPTAYNPDELSGFLLAALERERPDRTVRVIPRAGDRKKVAYEQRAPSTADTPVSRLFLLLALTGCRLGDALNLEWRNVDLDRGRIFIEASSKTGRPRHVPLAGEPTGDIAPRLARLMRAWWQEDTTRKYVLPHGSSGVPTYPKGAWNAVDEDCEGQHLNPQRLRQNFTSYGASLGRPVAVVAMWQGHSVQVAEEYYRAQLLARNPAAGDFEEAMGLDEIIQELINDSKP
ncbi:MAG: tyrosine-type recombinase/integrase [Planctomycetes bacterium]|nr:tyrosine-type recombinase/integrase [Planctomycetota bacterium]